MAKIVLDDIASGYNLNKINTNFDKIEAALNDQVLYRDVPEGETNTVKNSLDMDSNDILNVGDLRVLGVATIGGKNIDALNSALVWRGTWDAGTSYGESDAVYYLGTSYIATASNTNEAPPSANWNTLAAQGAPGAGSGDVNGPASSTDNNVVTFNAGTGKLIKDSGIASTSLVVTSNIGVSVQAYDVDTVKTDVDQQFSKVQRTAPITNNTVSYDLSASATSQDIVSTPTSGGVFTFTGIRAGVKGEILFTNTTNYAFTKAATVKSPSTFLSTISATGRYRLAYSCLDGTNVDITSSGVLT
jgi:hypothetical protein